MDPALASKLARTREQYKAQLATALTEDADPLAAYDAFVKWTIDNYSPHLAQSGLLELLEEATRYFVEDDAYKSDLRYLKLWLLYASHVEDPTVIYAFLHAKSIGKIYAQTYQEYADALERRGRRAEADAIYQKGIQRRARPVDPLKRRYEEFKSRTSAPPSKQSSIAWQDAPSETRALRRAPLKNHPSSSLPASSSKSSRASSNPIPASHPSSSTASEQTYNPYALMLAPPEPRKRKEKLRFNFSLLFTEDGVEYSMQEARARSMGLLGKKWGPPPALERTRVGFSGDASKGSKTMTTYRFTAGAEPTVTLATKEALADVFSMFNSPEKSMRFGPAAGSKHVRKIVPITPMPRILSNENAEQPKPSNMSFKPFVDENAHRGNKNPAGPVKITPYVDPNAGRPAVAPNPNRPVLAVKEPPAPIPGPKTDENALGTRQKLSVYIDPVEPSKPAPVFTLTPASTIYRDRPFSEDTKGSGESIFRPPSAGVSKFTPFSDENAPKVFSRPVPKNENAPPPTFTPFVDKPPLRQPLASSASGRPILGERTPLRAVYVSAQAEEPEDEEQGQEVDVYGSGPRSESETPTTESDADAHSQFELERANSRDAFTSESSEDVDDFDVDYQHDGYVVDDALAGEGGAEDSMYDEGEGDGGGEGEGEHTDGYRAPLGGRFGQFDVMTPITERTFEYTMSTRGQGTPGYTIHRDTDAVEAAEQLAAELREDNDDDEAEEVVDIEERTGTLSLADAMDVATSFKPPNPCNPFDPPIMVTLLKLLRPDPAFHDLRGNDAGQLDALQKFAKKKTRRASGNSTRASLLDGETLEIALHDRRFAVIDKLGEGGFGAVFEAIDLDLAGKSSEDDDDDDDEDEEYKNRVALKVVKPRNLWEFHVLRRIHTTLPINLLRSIITPQALYAFRDESFLVLELRKQGTLLDIVNRAPSAGITQQGACLDELLVMFFAVELMRLLEGLHRAGFIHGDMKIDNCLLRLEDVPGPASAWQSLYQPSGEGGWAHKGITLIDFGRTIDTSLFPSSSQRFIAEWPTDARDCFEAREGRPWTFQTDYYGLAGIIYCMLYGKYIEASSVVPAPTPDEDGNVHYKLANPFKRYWQGDLWTRLFDVLLNPTLVRPDGKLPVTDELAALRVEMEAWLQANCNRGSNSLKGLMKKIGVAILSGKDGR